MQEFNDFIENHSSIILTTHDRPDADGLGAEILLAHVLAQKEKEVRIINSAPIPERFAYMDPGGIVESWDASKHAGLPEKSALIIVDTSDEYNIGLTSEAILSKAKAVFVIDHHELNPLSTLKGYIDPTSSSTCEMIMDIVDCFGISLNRDIAAAAFSGIVYDTGSFAYAKTSERTFKAALTLVKTGIKPYDIYQNLFESSSTGALLLQKKVLSTLEIYNDGNIAVQILRKEDLESTGANFEDAEAFINVPLKSKNVEVSIMIKENHDGSVRCSLRSKGKVSVSKIAQNFSGGGHATAAGFRSKTGIEETLVKVLAKTAEALDKR
ncbi:bifunctional oligoribonuclease/PAP phosphatase NrnA [Treponema sp. OttesenSCG-928-L16]|nr:bifunctional oligoribonuclease/PAP phosphatase NrnA [Treponema sp. OttesenSCG-928-L16]